MKELLQSNNSKNYQKCYEPYDPVGPQQGQPPGSQQNDWEKNPQQGTSSCILKLKDEENILNVSKRKFDHIK